MHAHEKQNDDNFQQGLSYSITRGLPLTFSPKQTLVLLRNDGKNKREKKSTSLKSVERMRKGF